VNERLTVLVVEEDREVREYLAMALRCFPYKVTTAEDGLEALEHLKAATGEIAAVLLDFVLPNRDGFGSLHDIRQLYPELPVILMSGSPSPLTVVTAMKNGATDFLAKPVTHEDVQKAITRALDGKIVQPAAPLRKSFSGNAPSNGWFSSKSAGMASINAILPQVAWSEAPVLIQGETGSGKEVIARALHANSRRAKKPFFKLNCAALPSELVESELFGYERGAFTGAFQRKPGIFEMADGGTILLDEIGDMDVRLQAKLLQVLQDHEFQRIGGKDTIKVDVRVIAATHCDLEKNIFEGKFREDLYYRLNVMNLVVPPLRDRKEDLFGLADFLLHKHTKPGEVIPTITPDLRSAILAWDWPGNVRELENFVRKFLIFEDAALMARDLNARRAHRRSTVMSSPVTQVFAKEAPAEPNIAEMPILEQVSEAKRRAEADAILVALKSTHWNRKQAATMLNIDYKALLYKMKKLGLGEKHAPTDEDTVALPFVASLPLAAHGSAGMAAGGADQWNGNGASNSSETSRFREIARVRTA
jgi:two-component system response regulator AtoC